MEIINLNLLNAFHPDIDSLRQRNYFGYNLSDTTKDEFDDISMHLVAYSNDKLIGTVRMTIEPPSVIGAWSTYKDPLPHGDTIVNLTRAVVEKEWRRKSIYRLLMIEIVLIAYNLNLSYAIAAIEPHMKAKEFLIQMGFVICGKPSSYSHPPFGLVECENIILDLQRNIQHFENLKNEIIEQFNSFMINVQFNY